MPALRGHLLIDGADDVVRGVVEWDEDVITRVITDGDIEAVPAEDVGSALVLPGIIDIHGDAFERALMPRDGVAIDYGHA